MGMYIYIYTHRTLYGKVAGFKIIKFGNWRRNASYKLYNPDFPSAGPLSVTVRAGAYGRALG